jgi:lipid-binding SYLF domain-containing protein
MKSITRLSLLSAIAIAFSALVLTPTHAVATRAKNISRDSREALQDLLASNSGARNVARQSVAVLVFPSIKKGGFMVAFQRGIGALFVHGRTAGYYESVAGSYGFQAGIQKFGYALFFTSHDSLSYLNSASGWNVGTAPSLVVVDKGMSGSIGTLNLRKGIYAFFFNQAGLMGGLGLQGSKITRYQPSY